MRRVALLALLAACRNHVITPPAAPPSPARSATPSPSGPPEPEIAPAAPPEPEIPYGASLYDLEEHLVDQHGATIGLDVFRGHPVLITMFYGSCPAACPRLLADLAAIDAALDPATRAELRVLLISFDAARDTPAVLSAHAAQLGLDPTRWRFAAADDDAAREISAALAIRWRRLSHGVFFHTSVITLLAHDGAIVARTVGLGTDPAPLVARLRRLGAGS